MDPPPSKRFKEAEGGSRSGEAGLTPITLLSGFLGAGKTTLLKHILENKEGLKVGVVVNDMAEVNIDAALIANKSGNTAGGTADQSDIVHMENGCACCSAAEELFGSLEKLATAARARSTRWDHIVIEMSGVGEPREVRDNLTNVNENRPEQLHGCILHTMVTVIDGSTFLKEFKEKKTVEERTDLGVSDFTDGRRKIVDLMCEQIECADVLIANKLDLISADEVALLREALTSLNPLAAVHTTERGRLDLTSVLAAAGENSVAKSDEEGDMRRIVTKIKEQEKHEHGQTSHKSGKEETAHEHGHVEGHEHGHSADTCDDPSHSHGHDEHQEHAHGHMNAAEEGSSTHGHEHDHASAALAKEARHAKRFGITSFVYTRRRPFHPMRLMSVIRQLPVKNEPVALCEILKVEKTAAARGSAGGAPPAAATGEASPMHALIRSKGFIWLSNTHPQMFTWALAGKHFELKHYAMWWHSVSRDEWPTDQREIDLIMKDWEEPYGDHRQELVFIGVKMDVAAITKLFDECLLNDAEMEAYRQRWVE